jgi:hypothetical protein
MPSDETEYQLTPEAVAAQLGITPSTLRVLTHNHKVRGYELGKRVPKAGGGYIRLFSVKDVALLASRRKRARPDGN